MRKLIRNLVQAEPSRRISLGDVITRSHIFHHRGNCQLGFPPSLGYMEKDNPTWWEATENFAMVAAAESKEEVPSTAELRNTSCRDHLSFLHLVPASHVRMLKH